MTKGFILSGWFWFYYAMFVFVVVQFWLLGIAGNCFPNCANIEAQTAAKKNDIIKFQDCGLTPCQ